MVSNAARLQKPIAQLILHVANGAEFDRRFAWDKKLTPVDYA